MGEIVSTEGRRFVIKNVKICNERNTWNDCSQQVIE